MRGTFKRRPKRKPEWRIKRKLKQRLRNKLDNHRRKAGGRFTVAQWLDKLELFNNCCAYCGEPSDKLEVEHMIPIIKGGKHEDSNIVPACRKCNAQKGELTIDEWLIKLKGEVKDVNGILSPEAPLREGTGDREHGVDWRDDNHD